MQKIEIGATYKHYKGNVYKIIALAKHSETLEDMIVYQAVKALDDLIGKQRREFMHCHCKSTPFRNTEICEETVSVEWNAARCVASGKFSVSCLRRSLYRHIFQKRNSGILFFYKKSYITTKKFVQTHKLRS